MKNIICISMIASFLILFAGCSEPAPPPPPPDEPAAVEPPAPPPVAAPEPPKAPEPAVSKDQIEKAAGLYKVLNDAALPEDKKQEQATAQLQANGWTEESYQALLYDIAQDPPSRAAYVELTGAR
jgi:hypothetical protein